MYPEGDDEDWPSEELRRRTMEILEELADPGITWGAAVRLRRAVHGPTSTKPRS